jgi:hypothetical protein
MSSKISSPLLRFRREVFRGKKEIKSRILERFKDEELLSVVLLINDDIQKTFSRYTDLSINRMPEEYNSVFEPERPPPPRKPVSKSPQPEPEPVPFEYIAPSQLPVQQVIEQSQKTKPPPIAPENVFNLFDQPKEQKVEKPVNPLLIDPLMQSGPAAPLPPEDTVTKLNSILNQMQMREEEERRQRQEEEDRREAMKAQQQRWTTGFGMNHMMNSMMLVPYGMNPFYQSNPYMSMHPGTGMQRPTAPGSLPYQVLISL